MGPMSPPPPTKAESAASHLVIRGAREHNLKDVHLELPRDALIVFTGLSGSGKSSLAFDTIYAEGQRRYVESLSSYARQFLGQMEKPDVDFRRSGPSRRSTTTSGCSTRASGSPTAPNAAHRSPDSPPARSSTRS